MQPDGITLSDRERDILRTVLAPFAGRIERVAVFGSRALNRAKPASDIDLVLYGSLDDRTAARIWSLMDQSSLAVTVDVVRYEGLAPGPFLRHVDAVAKTLFTRQDLQQMHQAARAA